MPRATPGQHVLTGHNAGMNRSVRLLVASFLLMLAACAGSPTAMNPRDNALTNYGVAIRWSEFTEALEFVDPVLRQRQPLTDLERERLKQIRVTGYEVKSKRAAPDGTIEQTVEIRLISKNTQIERIVTDLQHWRWDAASKQFWLTSGLPDFTAQ